MTGYKEHSIPELIALMKGPELLLNKAFRVIYERYKHCLYSYCKSKTNDEESAKDLYQEVWLAFYEAVKADKAILKLPAYLFGIAENLIKKQYRETGSRIKIGEKHFDLNQIIGQMDPGKEVEQKEIIDTILKTAGNLGEKTELIFRLRWIDGLGFKDIAATVDESEDNVRQKANRAMNYILENLKPYIDDIIGKD